MSFIVTATGRELDVRYPRRTGEINIFDIAWSLAQINRFNGHAIRPYSVAEHSLLVCEIAERELGLGIPGRLAALMHDAHEFGAGDMHTPGKREIGPGWQRWEDGWQHDVQTSFALRTASVAHRDEIRRADLIALATERRDLMHRSPTAWEVLEGIEPVDWVDLHSPERRAMNWEDWRDRFLDEYHSLDFARNELAFNLTAPGRA